MPLPKIAKDYNLIVDGRPYYDKVSSFTLPDITVVTEDIRNAGSDFPDDIDMGLEKLVGSFVLDEYDPDVFANMGLLVNNVVQLTFLSSMENDEVQEPHRIEMQVRLRGNSRGEFQTGNRNQVTINFTCKTYRETINNRPIYDLGKNKRVINGVDQLAQRRLNLAQGV